MICRQRWASPSGSNIRKPMMISPTVISRKNVMLLLSESARSTAEPLRVGLIHYIDSGSSTTKAVPISVPMIEPVPPMMTMARKMIERSMPKPSLETTS